MTAVASARSAGQLPVSLMSPVRARALSMSACREAVLGPCLFPMSWTRPSSVSHRRQQSSRSESAEPGSSEPATDLHCMFVPSPTHPVRGMRTNVAVPFPPSNVGRRHRLLPRAPLLDGTAIAPRLPLGSHACHGPGLLAPPSTICGRRGCSSRCPGAASTPLAHSSRSCVETCHSPSSLLCLYITSVVPGRIASKRSLTYSISVAPSRLLLHFGIWVSAFLSCN